MAYEMYAGFLDYLKEHFMSIATTTSAPKHLVALPKKPTTVTSALRRDARGVLKSEAGSMRLRKKPLI